MSPSDRPIEVAMTHRVGLSGGIERCLRPAHVLETAKRMRQWGQQAETCQSCHSLPAVSLRGGLPLCSRCRDQRAIQMGTVERDALGRAPRPAVREDGAGDGPQLRGHMIVFNVKSVDLGGFTEIIRPAAADRLNEQDLRALWNHDSAITIGRVSAGTMRARKVTRGVATEIDPPRWAGNYVESVDRRDITGMSFAFSTLEDDWHLEEGEPVREVFDMVVYEGSPVSFPAYPQTDLKVSRASARSVWSIERETAERVRLAR